jgi:nitrite reductase/ring-hydroxylating ferredoxin subunit
MGSWVEIAKVADFMETDRKLVNLDEGRGITVFKIGSEFFAVDAWCSHEKAALVLGDVTDHEIACSLHGARFDLRTGRNLSLPAVRPVASYPVKVEEGKIYAEI